MDIIGIWTIAGLLVVGFSALWYRLGRIERKLDNIAVDEVGVA